MKQHKLHAGLESALELGDRSRVGTFLWTEEPRRLEQGRAHVTGDERGDRHRIEDLEQAGASIHRRRPAESEHEAVRSGLEGCEDELTEAAARRCQRLEPRRVERHRSGGLDDSRSFGKDEPARPARRSVGVVDVGLPPLPAPREPERLGRSLAAVGDRELDRVRAD